MLRFMLRRAALAWLVITGSFAFIYSLAATVGDPLAEIRLSNPPNLEYLLLAATRELRLDQPIPERFLGWYFDALSSIVDGSFSLGSALNGRPVTEGLSSAIAPTLFLVCVSILIALMGGSAIGIFVAIRRLGFRESILSLLVFLGYVSPVFWIGHLLKQYVVIVLNDGAVQLSIWFETIGLFIGSLIFLALVCFGYLSYYQWNDRKSRRAIQVVIPTGIVSMGLASELLPSQSSYLFIVLLFSSATALWTVIWALLSKGAPRRVSFGFKIGIAWVLSFTIQKLIFTMPEYMARDEIGGRPFPSFAYESVWYETPDFWVLQLDRALHLILPAFAISITTIAIYFQVVKNAAIESLESDYVKMARAKGVSDIEVLVRHVFRSCYLSLVNTFVPNFLYLFNGVIIAELVFGWQGLGTYLMSALFNYDLNRLMGGIFVLGVATFIGMLASDLIIHRLDPRIREFGR